MIAYIRKQRLTPNYANGFDIWNIVKVLILCLGYGGRLSNWLLCVSPKSESFHFDQESTRCSIKDKPLLIFTELMGKLLQITYVCRRVFEAAPVDYFPMFEIPGNQITPTKQNTSATKTILLTSSIPINSV